jgi:HK97 family phage major capsid protein
MDEEQILEAVEQKMSEAKSHIDTKTAESNAVVEKLKSDYAELETKFNDLKEKGASADDLVKMQEHLDKLDIKLQGKSGKGAEVKTLDQQIEEKFADTSIKASIDELKNNRGAATNLQIKAVGTMLLGNYAGTTLTTTVDTNISGAPKRRPLFRNIVNSFTVSGNKVTWVNKVAGEGGAGMTAEAAAKSQLDFDFVEESASVRKVTAYVKVSKEALDDLSFLRNEINTELVDAIQLKLDDQLSNGNGTAPNLKGILQYAPTFSVTGTDFDGGVFNANRLDVLRTAIAIIANERFQPNYVAINPLDAALMDLEKGTDGHYILPPFVTANGMTIAGVSVIESQSITSGTFLVGDFTKSNLGIKEEININLGYENDDFTKNLVTILAEMRAVHYIKDHHKKAFLQGSFDTAIAAITQDTGA